MTKLGTRCPTCGRSAVHAAVRDVTTRRSGRPIVVKAVAIEECAHCGERLFDLAALRKLEEARRNRSRRRPAA